MRTRLNNKLTALIATSALTLTAVAAGPATRPVAVATAGAADATSLTGTELTTRAQQAFNRGDYTVALPLLRKMASEAEKEPAKLASLQERIRVSEKALAAAKAQGASGGVTKPADAQAAAGNRPDNTPEVRKPHAAPKAGQVYETTIKDLGNFEYDQERGGGIPADVEKLSGRVVRLKGYMIPMDQAENITQFALVPSLFACCVGQPPQIQHTIVVNCPKGKAVGYSADELSVEGTLNVREKKDDGYIISLFELEVLSVKLAPKG